jgi:hypothetical protein
MIKNIQDLVDIHESYKKSMFELGVELQFWQHFITQWAIPEYRKQFGDRLMNSAIYVTYDNSPMQSEINLKCSPDAHYIHSKDLELQSKELFNWVMNHSLVRAYNALETLLLRAINSAYLHLPVKSYSSRREVNKIHTVVVKALAIPTDRTNNKHLIQFLKENCPEFQSWIELPMRIDLPTTRDDFFYMISVLRHCIVHQGMVIYRDTVNELHSRRCKDLFHRHFHLVDAGNDSSEIRPVQETFTNVLALITEFSVNTLKFMSGQQDLQFLRMH